MISSLHGTVLHVDADAVELVVSGVGFTVSTPPDVRAHARVGDELQLYTAMIVRDDALSLYGFADRQQSALFGVLLTVTGVGPKSALGVLSAMTADEVAQAVADGDDAPFRRVSGIGPKTAKLIIVQLAGKLAAPAAAAPAATAVTAQVVTALVGLGWSERVASEALELVGADGAAGDDETVQTLLRRALTHLGPVRTGADRG